MKRIAQGSSLRERALDDLLTHTSDVLDDYLWSWQTGVITTAQYERQIDLLVEERIIELSQRPTSESSDYEEGIA